MNTEKKQSSMNLRKISYTSIFVALTAIGAFIEIPTYIPFTLQVLVVLLSGFVLGPKLGAISQIAYVVLGLIGLPIFAKFRGGPGAIYSPTFGFLLSFPFAAALVGYLSRNINKQNFFKSFMSVLPGLIPIYLFGLIFFMYYMNNYMGANFTIVKTLQVAFVPYIGFDILKVILTVWIGRILLNIIEKRKI